MKENLMNDAKRLADATIAKLEANGYFAISPSEFYRALFPLGCLEFAGKQVVGRYNAMIQHENGANIYLHDDLNGLDSIHPGDTAYISCASYAGKCLTKDLARELYAIVVKLRLSVKSYADGLEELFREQVYDDKYHRITRSPELSPTYIVTAGQAVYLFYLFQYPIPLYKDFRDKLQSMSNVLCKWVHKNARSFASGNSCIPEQDDILRRYPVVGTEINGAPVQACQMRFLHLRSSQLIRKALQLKLK